MTDSEKLDFLVNNFGSLDEKVSADSQRLDVLVDKVGSLDKKFNCLDEKVTSLDERMTHVEGDIIEIKADIRQLHKFDKLILDEVERVHSILDTHKADKSVHSA